VRGVSGPSVECKPTSTVVRTVDVSSDEYQGEKVKDTRSGLKISGSRSYGGNNSPQGLDLNITESKAFSHMPPQLGPICFCCASVYDDTPLCRQSEVVTGEGGGKKQPTSQEERTISEDY